jgi:multicomponent Na+:H+ antiporter subunit C
MQTTLFLLSAFSLVLVGIYGILTRRNLVRILLALNIMETGINLLLVAFGYFEGGKTPIITGPVDAASASGFVDPLPHALVLTSIVIGLGTTALALTLTLRFFHKHRTLVLGDEKEPILEKEVVE